MSLIPRIVTACALCLLLSNCGLINTALRLAPLALLFADEEGKATGDGKTLELRGKEVQTRGVRGLLPADGSTGSGLAFKH